MGLEGLLLNHQPAYIKNEQGQKEEIIEAYFGKTGNQYNMGRTHINSCDFSLENYAHCDTPGDLNLSTFLLREIKKWSSHSSKML